MLLVVLFTLSALAAKRPADDSHLGPKTIPKRTRTDDVANVPQTLPQLIDMEEAITAMQELMNATQWNSELAEWIWLQAMQLEGFQNFDEVDEFLERSKKSGDGLKLLKLMMLVGDFDKVETCINRYFVRNRFFDLPESPARDMLMLLRDDEIPQVTKEISALVLGEEDAKKCSWLKDHKISLLQKASVVCCKMVCTLHAMPVDFLSCLEDSPNAVEVVEALNGLAKEKALDLTEWYDNQEDVVKTMLDVVRGEKDCKELADMLPDYFTNVPEEGATIDDVQSETTPLSILRYLQTKEKVPKDTTVPIVWWTATARVYPDFCAHLPKEIPLTIREIIPTDQIQDARTFAPYLQSILGKTIREDWTEKRCFNLRILYDAMKKDGNYTKEVFFYLAMVDGTIFRRNSLRVAQHMPSQLELEDKYGWWLFHFRNFTHGPVQEKAILGFNVL